MINLSKTSINVFNNIAATLSTYTKVYSIKLNYAGNRETVDTFDNEEEAIRMLKEYSLNADKYSFYYMTTK